MFRRKRKSKIIIKMVGTVPLKTSINKQFCIDTRVNIIFMPLFTNITLLQKRLFQEGIIDEVFIMLIIVKL